LSLMKGVVLTSRPCRWLVVPRNRTLTIVLSVWVVISPLAHIAYTQRRVAIEMCLFPLFDRHCGLVVRGPGFDSPRYQIFWEVVGLERGPLWLVRITEEVHE
jgi:hypothetical protein